MSKTAVIAKNTLFLYLRQILIIIVNLYIVRVRLDILGVENFGLYNLVSSIVIIFSFINIAMTSSTQRFLNFALGKNDNEYARNIYSTSYLIHILIIFIIILLAETAGIIVFYSVLNIPPDRLNASFIAYQICILTVIIEILRVPNTAVIIANEKMSFFAYLSIADILIKLGIVFMLYFIHYDKLIIYTILLTIGSVIIFSIEKIYCNKNFLSARFRFVKDKKLFKQLASFSIWSTFGEFANVCSTRGINVLINVFFGIIINASMAIATQVFNTIYRFVTQFQIAFKPQIIQSYSSGDEVFLKKLIFRTAKFSFYLMYFIILPFYINADFVFRIWLTTVPEYVIIFTKLMLLSSLEITITAPLDFAIQATGNIKKYKIIVSILVFLNLPLSLLLLYLGFTPPSVLFVKLIFNFIIVVYTLYYSKKMINLSVKEFLADVIFPILIIVAMSSVPSVFISGFFTDWIKLLVTGSFSSLILIILVYLIGINKQERTILNGYLLKFFTREKIK